MVKALQEQYYREEMPKIRQNISDFKAEMGAWGKCRRLDYLYDSLIELDWELIERQRAYQKSIEDDRPYIERSLIASYIPEIEKEIVKLEREINFIVNGSQQKSNITPEMIEQARQYPLESLIEVTRGMALCPFHGDHHPSMGIKHNRAYCFACGWKGDSIAVYQKLHHTSFIEAVKALQ